MTDSERLQVLEDREEIRQIFVDYAKYLDSGDHAGYASLFASDGVLVAQLGEAVGPAAIEAILDENLGPHVTGHLPTSIHVMTNQQIDVDGDTATTDLVWYYLTSDPDTVPTILQSGHYNDDLVREDGRWRIKRHEISRAMGRSPMDSAAQHPVRRARHTRAGPRGQGRDLGSVHGVQAPPRRARLQVVRLVVHRRRGLGREPRQGDRSG